MGVSTSGLCPSTAKVPAQKGRSPDLSQASRAAKAEPSRVLWPAPLPLASWTQRPREHAGQPRAAGPSTFILIPTFAHLRTGQGPPLLL